MISRPFHPPVRGAAIVLSGMLCALLLACAAPGPAPSGPTPGAARQVAVPNPAAVACVQGGGTTFTERQPDGAERGMCRLPSGEVCDQWAFFRKTCGPGASTSAPASTGPGVAPPRQSTSP